MFIQKRLKTKNRKKTSHKKTIDKTHTNFVKKCKSMKTKVKKKMAEREKLQKRLKILEKNELSNAEWKEKQELTDKLDMMEYEIKNCRSFENEYYMDTAHLLFEYYDMKENDETILTTTVVPKKNCVLNFFTNADKSTKDEEKEHTMKNLNSIIDEYRRKTNEYTIPTNVTSPVEECEHCKCNKILVNNDSVLLCPKCGEEQEVLLSQDKPSYKEPPKEYTHFAYKRINHFNEWLSQFQAKESTFISIDIIEKLQNEIKKERIKKEDIKNIPVSKIRSYLKKLGLNKYYEHIPHIMTRLTGIPPPLIPREKEEVLRTMFKQI